MGAKSEIEKIVEEKLAQFDEATHKALKESRLPKFEGGLFEWESTVKRESGRVIPALQDENSKQSVLLKNLLLAGKMEFVDVALAYGSGEVVALAREMQRGVVARDDEDVRFGTVEDRSVRRISSSDPEFVGPIESIQVGIPEKPIGSVKTPYGLNMRRGPGTENNTIRKLEFGETVYVIGENSDRSWLKVEDRRGNVGWVINNTEWFEVDDSEEDEGEDRDIPTKEEIQKSLQSDMNLSSTDLAILGTILGDIEYPNFEKEFKKVRKKVIVDILRLRDKPTTNNSKILIELPKNSIVEVLDMNTSNQWLYVKTDNGTKGWISQGTNGNSYVKDYKYNKQEEIKKFNNKLIAKLLDIKGFGGLDFFEKNLKYEGRKYPHEIPFGSYLGVDIISGGHLTAKGENHYQCVELVKRFYREIYNIDLAYTGDGKDYANSYKLNNSYENNKSNIFNTKPGKFESYKNGSSTLPRTNDIIS